MTSWQMPKGLALFEALCRLFGGKKKKNFSLKEMDGFSPPSGGDFCQNSFSGSRDMYPFPGGYFRNWSSFFPCRLGDILCPKCLQKVGKTLHSSSPILVHKFDALRGMWYHVTSIIIHPSFDIIHIMGQNVDEHGQTIFKPS